MKVYGYSIFDVKAKLWSVPQYYQNEGMAIREFTNLVRKDGHPFNTNPEDYSLWAVSMFNQEAPGQSERVEPREVSRAMAIVIGDQQRVEEELLTQALEEERDAHVRAQREEVQNNGAS